MSDSNRVNLAFFEEAAFGVRETAEAYQNINFMNETLHNEVENTTSQTLRSDRQIANIIQTNLSAAGQVNFEWQHSWCDPWLIALLMSAGWSTAYEATGLSATATFSSQQISVSSGTPFTNFSVGAWVYVSGFTNYQNNGVFKINGKDTAHQWLNVSMGKYKLVDEGPTGSVDVVQGPYITNGVEAIKTYTIEKEFTDLSNEFAVYTGMALNTLGLSVSPQNIITGNVGFVGKREQDFASTGSSGNVAATSNRPLNAINNVYSLNITATEQQPDAFNWSIALNNNLRPRLKIGELGAFSIGTGSLNITGNVQVYFEGGDNAYDSFLSQADSALGLVTQDPNISAGNGQFYVIDIPAIRFTSGNRDASGLNQDVFGTLGWEAFRKASEDVTIRIARPDVGP